MLGIKLQKKIWRKLENFFVDEVSVEARRDTWPKIGAEIRREVFIEAGREVWREFNDGSYANNDR